MIYCYSEKIIYIDIGYESAPIIRGKGTKNKDVNLILIHPL